MNPLFGNNVTVYSPQHFITVEAEVASQGSQSSMGGIQMETNRNPAGITEQTVVRAVGNGKKQKRT